MRSRTADPATAQVVRPEHAYLLSDILSDNRARQPSFGLNNRLVIDNYRVAAKTGTSGTDRFDVRDGWTIGYTPEVVTAVWVGNTNNQPLGEGVSGTAVAAPIWNNFMRSYLEGREPLEFPRPSSVVSVEICADSGTRPGPGCTDTRVEYYAEDQLPPEASEDFIRQYPIDLWTGMLANDFCPETVYNASYFTLLVNGREEVRLREQTVAQQWLEGTKQAAPGQTPAVSRSRSTSPPPPAAMKTPLVRGWRSAIPPPTRR
jgi:membrane carboxypeptidase/penicillin-binding protein PbpC